MFSLPTQEHSISLHVLKLSLKQLFSFPHNLNYLFRPRKAYALIVSLFDSFVISFFTPCCVFVFHFLLKFSWLKQLFHHVIPLLQNPSWQSFTICFSNSFPASSAQTLPFSLAGFLPPSQTSWPFPTLLLMSAVPPNPPPLSLCLQVVAAQGPRPWQHSIPQGALPPVDP